MTSDVIRLSVPDFLKLIRAISKTAQDELSACQAAVTESAQQRHADAYGEVVSRMAELIAIANDSGVLEALEDAARAAMDAAEVAALPMIELA